MIDLNISTPGLLFPTISLLMLAYTNRFLALAALMRELIREYKASPSPAILDQIANLRRRIGLLRDVQGIGVFSLLLCAASIFAVYLGQQMTAQITFGASLLAMLASLILALVEIAISIRALDIQIATLALSGRPDVPSSPKQERDM